MIFPVNEIGITKTYHHGKALDFGYKAGNKNQPIYAVDYGYIYKIEKQVKGGNVIFIKHETGLVSVYGHLQDVNVSKNQKVFIGEKIGTMGKTGTSCTAEHLHFEIKTDKVDIHAASDIDPLSVCQVAKNQSVCGGIMKDKIMSEPANNDFTTGEYRLLDSKALRKTPTISNNIALVKETPNIMRAYLTSNKPNNKAYFKRLTDLRIREIVKDKEGRTWGKCGNFYVVLIDKTNIRQAIKLS